VEDQIEMEVQERLEEKEAGGVDGGPNNKDYSDASDENDLLGMIGGGGGEPGTVLRQGRRVNAKHMRCFMNILPKSISLPIAHFLSLKF
jgi:hypothetical protein